MTTKKFLAKCAIATASVVSASAQADAQADKEKERAYFSSNYQYCDAKKIASVWNTNPYGGKLVIGGKILAGLTNLADQDIASTGRSVPCRWTELGLSYQDAQKLASFWGRTIGDAKAKAEQMASDVGAQAFKIKMSHVIG